MDKLRRELSSFISSLGSGETTKEFFDLIKQVSATKSKQEETTLISQEIKKLREEVKKRGRDLNDVPSTVGH